MTSTSFNVGLGDATRNSSKDSIGAMRPPGGECSDLWGAEFKGSPCHQRVLKPPGGGSSDIFGLGGGEAQQSPRKVKQYMASNISLTDGAPAPSGTGPGSTSSAASTASSGETPSPGSPGSPTGTPTRNGTEQSQAQQAQSQAQEQVEVAAAGKAPDGEPRGRQFQMQSHFSLGFDSAGQQPQAEAAQAVQAAAQDGNPVTGEGYKASTGGAAQRNRVPPGGYSSGLW